MQKEKPPFQAIPNYSNAAWNPSRTRFLPVKIPACLGQPGSVANPANTLDGALQKRLTGPTFVGKYDISVH
jgi:hypothetical protein